jgi:hypothetical protein
MGSLRLKYWRGYRGTERLYLRGHAEHVVAYVRRDGFIFVWSVYWLSAEDEADIVAWITDHLKILGGLDAAFEVYRQEHERREAAKRAARRAEARRRAFGIWLARMWLRIAWTVRRKK